MTDGPFFYAIAIVAVTLAGLAKGGFSGIGMVSTPMLALATSPVRAAAIMLPILVVQDLLSLWSYRGKFDRWNIAVLVPSAALGIMAGYFLAAHVSDAAVEIALGVISIVFSVRSLLHRHHIAAPEKRPPVALGWFWGTIAGFTSMVSHAGAPPFQIFVMPQRLERDIFIGTSVMFFAIVNWIKIPPYLMMGQLSHDTLTTAFTLLPVAIISTYAGIWLIRRIDPEKFFMVVQILLGLIGLKLLWSGIAAIS